MAVEQRVTKRRALLVVWDLVATIFAYALASIVTNQEHLLETTDSLFVFAALAIINTLIYAFFRLYSAMWEYASTEDLMDILLGVFLGSVIGALTLWVIDVRLPIRVYFTATIILLILVGGIRFAVRYLYGIRKIRRVRAPETARPRTMIVGAGETGSMTIKRMATGDYAMQGQPILAVDDDPDKQGLHIHGVKVAGTTDDILSLVDRHRIEQIVIAIPSATIDERRRIFTIASETDCKLLTLPHDVRDLRVSELENVKLREVRVSDLLGRDEVLLDIEFARNYIAGRVVLVTGGGGSIGSEIVREVVHAGPRRIVLFDIYENGVFDLAGELREKGVAPEIVIEIGSVSDADALEDVFSKHEPDIVFHAAAHKHVPLMELNPREAVKNNVFGTLLTARAAIRHGAERFIFISTDKAVNPVNVMGATKRMGELIMQALSGTSGMIFAAVRFGNVLGSNGSVIPIFRRQIREGGPITITHPDIIRYFMTIPEAARLVIRAGGMAEGGEIFILDMGEPVRIVDLARNLIRLTGHTEEEIPISYVGLRPGEKLYEELLMDDEATKPTDDEKIMVSVARCLTEPEMEQRIARLSDVIDAPQSEIKATLAEVVPTYTPGKCS